MAQPGARFCAVVFLVHGERNGSSEGFIGFSSGRVAQ